MSSRVVSLAAVLGAVAVAAGAVGFALSRAVGGASAVWVLVEGIGVATVAGPAVGKLVVPRPRAAAAIAALAVVVAGAVHTYLDLRAVRARWERESAALRDHMGAAGVDDWEILQRDHEARMGARGWLAGDAAWELRAVAALIAGATAAMNARAAARRPSCATCGRWRDPEVLGEARHDDARAVADALRADAAAAVARLAAPDTRERLGFTVWRCPRGHDDGGGAVCVTEARIGRRRELVERAVAQVELGADAVAVLRGKLEEIA